MTTSDATIPSTPQPRSAGTPAAVEGPLGPLGSLVLGGNVFGWSADREESFAVLDAFADAGGGMIDTADVYSAWVEGHVGGESETLIGEWLDSRGRRDDVLIATKVFSHPDRPGLSAANIAAAVEDSLRRLRTDHIDLQYAHRDDPAVPQEEYLAAFDALVQAGKVRALGASNFTAERLRSAQELAARHGWTPFGYAQDRWNVVAREIEDTLVPTLAELGVVELPYSALASGFLSGKYAPGVEVESVRSGGVQGLLSDESAMARLAAVREVAADRGVEVASVALGWLRARSTVGAPIASARTVEQLPALLADVVLTPHELARIG